MNEWEKGSLSNTGPETKAQQSALQYLDRIAEQQSIDSQSLYTLEVSDLLPAGASWPGHISAVSTGPNTQSQLLALRRLGLVADEQESGIAEPQILVGTKAGPLALSSLNKVRGLALRKPFGLARVPWLLIILAVQTVLSLRLVWSNTAFPDEALYLWAGHLEWQHWLHGLPLPAFPTYFSGSPMVYPPMGAIADSLGGLAGARLLSLCFMLAASVLLYGTARKLFGERAGLLATALFASTATTQFLGAFATYDAMALMLLALAARLTVAAGTARGISYPAVLVTAGSVLALADAAKYAAALWDPVVIALAALAVWQTRGWRHGAVAGGTCAGSLAIVAAALLRLGGHPYWRGISFTTLSRQHGTSSPFGIMADSIGWAGVVAGAAVIGAVTITATRKSLPLRITAWVLAGAVTLAPLNQARIHVFTSLFKHVGFGEWFAAAVAGAALAALADAVPRIKKDAAVRTAIGAVLASALLGTLLATTHFTTWPSSAGFVAKVKPVIAGRGPVLAADNGNVIEYYLQQESKDAAFYGTWFFRYQDPRSHRYLTDAPAYADAIKHRFFRVIALSFDDSLSVDAQISAEIERYGGYRLIAVLPYQIGDVHSAYRIWVRNEK